MIYTITPIPKPRMTRADRWRKRPCVLKYFAFKDRTRELGIIIPECYTHIVFGLPMPKSWSKKKRKEMCGKPHQQRPDKDNLEKALLDAVYDEDCRVWDSRTTKLWAEEGYIKVEDI